MRTARNISILALIALGIIVLPGGGTAADLVYAIVSVIFAATLAFFAGRIYRERRIDIYALGDRHRALLYGAVVLILFALAASSELFGSVAGDGLFVLMLALSGAALLVVYRAWREY
jgi:uncharacterized membrane-anchored protein